MSFNAVKIGWFLIGLGAGAFGATILMKHELEKPIGEIEEYIPLEDREDFEKDENIEDISEDSQEDYSDDREYSEDCESSQKDISKYQGPNVRRGRERRDEQGSSRRNDRKEKHVEFSSNQDEVLDYYKSTSKDATRAKVGSERDKHENKGSRVERRESLEKAKRYSKMYQNRTIEKVLHQENSHRRSRNSYDVVRDDDISDSPSDDDYVVTPVYDADLHDEYTLERVDENIEIFLDDNPQDFITMIFYEGDNTLCDDGEQIVPNAEEIIGYEALSRLIQGGPGAENGVIFVHNLKTSLNYEVVLDAGSYQDTVIGQFESHLRDGEEDGSS